MAGAGWKRHSIVVGRAAPGRIAVAVALGLTAAGCASTLAGAGGHSAEASGRRLQESIEAAKRKDNVLANALAKQVIASRGFRAMEDADRQKSYTMVAATAALLERTEECYRYSRISTEMQERWNDEWRLRAVCGYATERWADTSYALTIIASRWPSDLGDHADSVYLTVWNRLGSLPDGAARRLSLGAWMVRAGWTPKGPPEAFSGMWQDLTNLEDAAGRSDLRDEALRRAGSKPGA